MAASFRWELFAQARPPTRCISAETAWAIVGQLKEVDRPGEFDAIGPKANRKKMANVIKSRT
jgi:hypothetical protein